MDLVALEGFLRTTGPLAVVDLETTGLATDPSAEMLEFGAVLLDAGSDVLTTLESLVRPTGRLPRAVQQLTGLSDADVADAPAVAELAKPIAAALAGRAVIAHNAEFERHFLSRFVVAELGECRYLDTQDLLSATYWAASGSPAGSGPPARSSRHGDSGAWVSSALRAVA